jgi:acyl carrier protein
MPEPQQAAAPVKAAASAEPVKPAEPATAAPPTHVPNEIADAVAVQIAQVLALPVERINHSRPLNKMGMDSLMAVELRNRIEREFKVKVPIVALLSGGTVTSLAQAVADGSVS